MSDETPRPDVCDSLIQDIQVRLQQLQAEMDRLRDEKLELELELADCKEMLEEQAKLEPAASPSRDSSLPPSIASRKRNYFHRLNCEWATYIRSPNKLVRFYRREEAVDAGYRPCKTCRS